MNAIVQWVYKRQRKQRSNCQQSLDHRKAKEFQKNITSASLIRRKPLTVWTSLVVQTVKSLPTMQETWVWSLGWEEPLEKETATHSSTLAWKIPWTEEPGRLQSMGSQRVRHNWATFHFTSYTLRKTMYAHNTILYNTAMERHLK